MTTTKGRHQKTTGTTGTPKYIVSLRREAGALLERRHIETGLSKCELVSALILKQKSW